MVNIYIEENDAEDGKEDITQLLFLELPNAKKV